MNIRPAVEEDRDAIWNIFHEVVAASDTYAFDSQMSREDALAYWFREDTQTYVAEEDRYSVGEAVRFPGTLTASPTGREQDRPASRPEIGPISWVAQLLPWRSFAHRIICY